LKYLQDQRTGLFWSQQPRLGSKDTAITRLFWLHYAIGRRVCGWIEKARGQEPSLFGTDDSLPFEVDRVLAALVNLGVGEAKQLEEALAASATP
jgi:hypothetical protein